MRELRATVEAAALARSGSEPVDADLLRFVAGDLEEAPTPAAPSGGSTLANAIEQIERWMLSEALAASGGNQSEAARVLGLSRVGLIRKAARLGLQSSRQDNPEAD